MSPKAASKSFQLTPGFNIQLVAAEPMVEDPVAMTFDEDGKLWVVEMRGFMPNIDREGEEDRVGRVSVLTDTDGDGQMDKSIIFIDSLILPRAIAVLSDGILIAESNPLWFAEDTDGDGKADKKTLVDSVYGGGGLPEHSPNGLWRGLDNWYYNAKARARYRRIGGQWITEKTEFRGQWGISHDDAGRLFYNYNWSQLHADLVPPNYLSRNPHHSPTTGIDHGLTIDRKIYPIRPNPAVNRGYIPGTLDEEGKLIEFTAACSPFVYRGKTLPKAFQGNAFVCEPSGNLVKRNVVTSSGFLLSAYDPSPGTEFLASTDERFRPVALTSGPDGALYIADMYRGIVQHGAYMTPYLKEQSLSRKLDRPVHMGRIWRVVPEKEKTAVVEPLSKKAPVEWVTLLSHPDGWYRDTGQRLLVERADPNVIPALRDLLEKGAEPLGRMHALWTLEGMGALTKEICWSALADKNVLVQTSALRLLEPLLLKDPTLKTQLGATLLDRWETAEPGMVLQMALSAASLEQAHKLTLLAAIVKRDGEAPLIRDAALSSLTDQEDALLQLLLKAPDWQTADPAKAIFIEMLASAIFNKGKASEIQALVGQFQPKSDTLHWQLRAALNGLAIQAGMQQTAPVVLSAIPACLNHIDLFDDAVQRQLNRLATGLTWPGKKEEMASAGNGKGLAEDELKQFALGRQQYLSICAGCHGTDGRGIRRFAPPLVQSEWVLGDDKKLALILLHGMEGPVEVNGIKYDAPDILPVMPSHSVIDDGDIAAILTYIRNEWGHQAGAVKPRTVGMTRVSSQGKVVPWSAEELKALPVEKETQ